MAHRCEHLCSASQLWLPHPALCVVPPECFWGLRVWSGAMGSKSGKLWNIADCDTLGCAHPSMFPIAWRNFHHKPALVASFILWLEYLLCAHHTHFPIFQLPGTHVDPLFCQPGPFMAC